MTARSSWHAPLPPAAPADPRDRCEPGRGIEDASASVDASAALVRARRPRREFTRQIAIDVALAVTALVIIALLS